MNMLKKKIIPIVVLLMTIGTVYADECSGGAGNIWSLHEDGSSGDYFSPGEDVYLAGQNFEPFTTYAWNITDQDAEGKVKPAVAEGEITTDENGDIQQTYMWTIPVDDYSDSYRTNLRYNDCTQPIFTKKDSFETIPEYPAVAIPAIMALGGYLTLRVKRRKLL